MTLTAVLFAGGLSSRMATDKSLIEISGQPLWRRQLGLLQALNPDVLWISARTRPAWCPERMDVVLDEPPSRGPLSGLVPVFARLQTSHLLTLAVDLPCMTVQMLKTLAQLAEPARGVVPVSHDLFEPLCAIYPRGAASLAATALRRGELSLQPLLAVFAKEGWMRSYPLTAAEEALFLNVNTPADLQQLNRR